MLCKIGIEIGREEGRAEGIIQTLKEMNFSELQIIEYLKNNMNINSKQAKKYYDKFKY